jgi:hypothetical protein
MDKYTLVEKESLICENCNFENEKSSLYCKNCGVETFKLNESENKEINFLEPIKIALLSTITLLIISFVYNIFVSKTNFSDYINPVNILLFMNMGKMEIFTRTLFSTTQMSIQIGIFALTIMPIVVISIFNILFAKKNKILINSLLIGAIYGILLGGLTIFTRHSLGNSQMIMVTQMSYMSVIFNGFMISFITTFIILKLKENNLKFRFFKLALKTIIIGILIVFVLLYILSLFNKNFIHDFGIYEYVSKVSIGVVLLQLSTYLWAFANLIPITIQTLYLSTINISSASLLLNTKLLVIAMIFISALIFIVVGSKIKAKDEIKYFSISYALIMGIISLITKIIISSTQSYVIIGFSTLEAIIISLVYSYLTTLIGYKLSKNL